MIHITFTNLNTNRQDTDGTNITNEQELLQAYRAYMKGEQL